jgi:hypothetical protein
MLREYRHLAHEKPDKPAPPGMSLHVHDKLVSEEEFEKIVSGFFKVM